MNLKENAIMIDGKYYQKANIVMLPSKEKSNIQLNVIHNILFSMKDGADIPTQPYQHICITSNEEIKEGDWYIILMENGNHEIHRKGDNDKSGINWKAIDSPWVKDSKKIIATTDNSLTYQFEQMDYSMKSYRLPQPSQSFIERYCSEYNKGNQIKDILVEVEEKYINGINMIDGMEFKLKVDKSNNITIKPIKDSWNREEVKELCWQAYIKHLYIDDKISQRNVTKSIDPFKEWINKNL